MEATRPKQSENESCLSDICDVSAVTPPPHTHTHRLRWWTLPTIAHCGEMIIESSGTIMEPLTGSLALTDFPGCITWAAPVDFIRVILATHATEAPGARVRARRALLVSKDPIVLSWKDRALSRMLQWEQLTHLEILRLFFLPVTLMGNSTLRQENACDEGIIGASEHVSGYYCNTLWWHS